MHERVASAFRDIRIVRQVVILVERGIPKKLGNFPPSESEIERGSDIVEHPRFFAHFEISLIRRNFRASWPSESYFEL
jgi:hypothetical protein